MRNICHVQSVEKQGYLVNEKGKDGGAIAVRPTGHACHVSRPPAFPCVHHVCIAGEQ